MATKRKVKTVVMRIEERPRLRSKIIVSILGFVLGFSAVLLGRLYGRAEATLEGSQQVVTLSQQTSRALKSGYSFGYKRGHVETAKALKREVRRHR